MDPGSEVEGVMDMVYPPTALQSPQLPSSEPWIAGHLPLSGLSNIGATHWSHQQTRQH